MNPTLAFSDTIKEVFAPRLRDSGFTGSGKDFRRIVGELIHAINIQGGRYGGQAALNVGIHATFLPTSPVDELPDPKSIKEIECEFRKRVTPSGEDDFWWEFGSSDQTAVQSAMHLAQTYFDVGEPFLNQYRTVEDLVECFTIESIHRGDYKRDFKNITASRAALAMARVHLYLGNEPVAKSYATEGMLHVGRGQALIPRFEEILSA